MTTILTYLLIAYGACLTIALACALERLGYWRNETCAAEDDLQAARAEIADDNIIIAWLRKQVSGHIRDNEILLRVNYCLVSKEIDMPPLDAGEMVAAAEEWLRGEVVG